MSSACPVCDASVALPANTEESEIVTCSDCQSRLVVDSVQGGQASLSEAPAIEEDWGQ